MKKFLDDLVAVGVLSSDQSPYNDEVTFYFINKGYQIKALWEHWVEEFEFDADNGEVLVRTQTLIDDDEWGEDWNVELRDVKPDQLTISKITTVTLAELQKEVDKQNASCIIDTY